MRQKRIDPAVTVHIAHTGDEGESEKHLRQDRLLFLANDAGFNRTIKKSSLSDLRTSWSGLLEQVGISTLIWMQNQWCKTTTEMCVVRSSREGQCVNQLYDLFSCSYLSSKTIRSSCRNVINSRTKTATTASYLSLASNLFFHLQICIHLSW